MRKVYSTALFGDGDRYARYLGAWVRGALNLFPAREDWHIRIHVDEAVQQSRAGTFLARLASEKLIEWRRMGAAPLCKAMLWRMAPVFEDGVDYVFCRDIDSPPMPRDRACCDQFIESGASVHTIHDNEQHAGIMGGLCDFNTMEFRRRTGLLSLHNLYNHVGLTDAQWAVHGADQNVLNAICLCAGGPPLFEHRYDGWQNGPGVRPARGAGKYACGAVSAKVPNVGKWALHGIDDIAQADRLGPHLGCADYDYETAIKFWDEHGDSSIARRVRECEVI
jgi:hypothetical protein